MNGLCLLLRYPNPMRSWSRRHDVYGCSPKVQRVRRFSDRRALSRPILLIALPCQPFGLEQIRHILHIDRCTRIRSDAVQVAWGDTDVIRLTGVGNRFPVREEFPCWSEGAEVRVSDGIGVVRVLEYDEEHIWEWARSPWSWNRWSDCCEGGNDEELGEHDDLSGVEKTSSNRKLSPSYEFISARHDSRHERCCGGDNNSMLAHGKPMHVLMQDPSLSNEDNWKGIKIDMRWEGSSFRPCGMVVMQIEIEKCTIWIWHVMCVTRVRLRASKWSTFADMYWNKWLTLYDSCWKKRKLLLTWWEVTSIYVSCCTKCHGASIVLIWLLQIYSYVSTMIISQFYFNF